MGRQIRADYEQVFMFPPSVEDWVGPDHPARFIRDFVDSLDLGGLGFQIPECREGRPPYAPDLLLKVWLYGYLNRIFSNRKLEKASREHMGLIWLTGMNPPDHSTLSRFFKANTKGIKGIFKQSIQVAVKADLMGLALHAVDGTKIPAKGSNDGVRTREQLQEMLEDILDRLDRSISDVMTEIDRRDSEDSGEYRLPKSMQEGLVRKQRIQRALQELEETDKKVVNPADPDARFMKNRRSKELSYNGQAIADQKSGMIVAADVVQDGADNGQLVPMIDQAKENIGEVARETVADAGYFSSTQIGLAAQREYEVVVSKSSGETSAEKGAGSDPYHHCRFILDEPNDCCICPTGTVLPFLQKKFTGKNKNEVRRYQCRDYKTCTERKKCCRGKGGRRIDISVHRKALKRHRDKRNEPENRKQLRARKAIIEPVFGWIKQQLGFRRWTVSGIDPVQTQWNLVCTAINLKKLYHHWKSGRLVLSEG